MNRLKYFLLQYDGGLLMAGERAHQHWLPITATKVDVGIIKQF